MMIFICIATQLITLVAGQDTIKLEHMNRGLVERSTAAKDDGSWACKTALATEPPGAPKSMFDTHIYTCTYMHMCIYVHIHTYLYTDIENAYLGPF